LTPPQAWCWYRADGFGAGLFGGFRGGYPWEYGNIPLDLGLESMVSWDPGNLIFHEEV